MSQITLTGAVPGVRHPTLHVATALLHFLPASLSALPQFFLHAVPLRCGLLALALALSSLAPSLASAQVLPRLQSNGPPNGPPREGPPLARFALPDGTPNSIGPLLQRALENVRYREGMDVDDDERQLRRLRSSAIDVLATEGFFMPTIEVAEDGNGRARYVLRVELGPRTTVTRLDLEFRGPIEQQAERIAQLRKAWELKAGQPFRDSLWSSSKRRLMSDVQDRDFPTATMVESAAEVDVETSSARLRVVIDSGPAFTLGPLQVSGLSRYEPSLVKRFVDFKEGDPYDRSKLLDFQRRLQTGPFFSSVQVEAQLDADKPALTPVEVRVREAQSKRVSVGLGASTNVGPRVEAMYRQVGLIGRPYTLQTGFGVDETRQVAFADILLPPKPNGARDSMGILGEHTTIENLATRRYAAAVARDFTFNRGEAVIDTRLALTAQRESQQLDDAPSTSRSALVDEQINDTLSLSYQWTRRRVDSITDPREGDVITLRGAGGIGRAGIGELLDKSFVHLYGRYVRYIPVFARDQIILRGEAGRVIADDINAVPTDFRFRTGGAGSVRGYGFQSLGTPVFDENGNVTAILPARTILVGSAEYVHWLNNTWGAAAFYDIGDAFERRPEDLASGYGLGVRYRTIAGPLALDVAYGERDSRLRFHFSIAISF